MTLRDALMRAAEQLHQNPDLRAETVRDAAMLLRHSLNISQATLLANPDRVISRDEQAALQALILRRLKNEPIQYITGEQEFFGLALAVSPAVLIPRPETETLVEAVLAELRPSLVHKPLRIADIGTGSGAIAIALAHQLPEAQITAVDISLEALERAATNAARHDVSGRIRFVHSDLFEALSTDELAFDAIVSNPPYVPTADRESLHPQVREFEPASALFAGESGLEIYRRLIPQAHAALKTDGLLALEIGHGQRDAIAALLGGWSGVRFVDDLQGIPRVAMARKL